MSDPGANVDIDDVLSSIRRLVSVDHGGDKRAPKTLSAAAVPRGGDKLVLTDDLRIPPQPELVSQEQLNNMSDNYTETLERRIAELEAAVTAANPKVEPADGEGAGDPHAPETDSAAASPDTTGVLRLDQLISDPPDTSEEEGGAPAPDTHEGEPEAAVTAEDDIDFESLADTLKSVEDAPREEVQTTAKVDHDDLWAARGEGDATQTRQDRVEVIAAERHRKRADTVEDAEFVFGNDDAVIDEEALRDMVAEIVRDELQGALGERITRNVRKLVRREIMRAISIRDFE